MIRRFDLLVALAVTACAGSPSTPTEPAPAPSVPAPAVAHAPDAGARDSAAPKSTVAAIDPGPPPVFRAGGARVVKSTRGLVVSVEAQATRVGTRILESGGNAVDAAVAVAFALAVTHPSAGNLGGGGFMLVRKKGGPTEAIDFRETAPEKLTREKFDQMIAQGGGGAVSVGVPGSVRGLSLAHEKFGKLPFEKVVAPAIHLAQKGHKVGSREAQTIVWSWPELKKDPVAKAEFGDGDQPKPEGSTFKRPGLAKVLERIQKQGADGFYAGETANAIVNAIVKKGGVLTKDDLSRYQAKQRSPLAFTYRGLDVETMPPPSAGGVALLEILTLLEKLGAHKLQPGSADELHLFIEASRRAQADKRFGVVDPDSLAPDVLEKKIAGWRDVAALLARVPIDPKHAARSSDVHPLFPEAMRELEHTTHLSVIDAEGNAVSLTTTLSASFGSKVVVPGTGIVLNNAVASFGTAGENLPVAGRRTTSSMAPTLVIDHGELRLVLGSPGGDTIPSTIAQVFRHLTDHGMTLDRAIDAPRVHHGFVPDEVRYERARPPPKPVLDDLVKLGHTLSKKTIPMGDANNLLVLDGTAYGYADPREGGLALAPR